MPRVARNVFAGIPHHITQRGNRREDVFFEDDDRSVYLEWLAHYCQKFDVGLKGDATLLVRDTLELVSCQE